MTWLRIDLALVVFMLVAVLFVVQAVFVYLALGGVAGYAMAGFTGLQAVAWFFVAQLYEEKELG